MMNLTPLWLGIGRPVEGSRTGREAIDVSGLDWRVEKIPASVNIQGSIQMIPKTWATVRMDTLHVLGCVGVKHEVVQNIDAFTPLDGLYQFPFGPRPVLTGSMYDGARVWLLIRLGLTLEPLPGDIIDEYLLISNPHDGYMQPEILWMPIRRRSETALNMRLGIQSPHKVFEFLEFGLITKKDLDIGDIYRRAVTNHYHFDAIIRNLIRIRPTEKQVTQTLERVFGSYISRKQTVQSERTRERVRELLISGPGTEITGVRETGWGLYNAITRYVDYEKTVNPRLYSKEDMRLEHAWFDGEGVYVKHQALDEILSLKG